MFESRTRGNSRRIAPPSHLTPQPKRRRKKAHNRNQALQIIRKLRSFLLVPLDILRQIRVSSRIFCICVRITYCKAAIHTQSNPKHITIRLILSSKLEKFWKKQRASAYWYAVLFWLVLHLAVFNISPSAALVQLLSIQRTPLCPPMSLCCNILNDGLQELCLAIENLLGNKHAKKYMRDRAVPLNLMTGEQEMRR